MKRFLISIFVLPCLLEPFIAYATGIRETTQALAAEDAATTPSASSIRVELGPEEVVFDSFAQPSKPEDIPDQSVRAFRDADGKVNLICGHFDLYREVGDDVTTTVRDRTAPVWKSHHQGDLNLHDNREWLAAVYTEDGRTVHALVHNEYHGDEVGNLNTKEDRANNGWYNSITYAVSTDGGKTFTHAPPPNHLVLAPYIPYDQNRTAGPYGYFEPSNIIKKDGFYYVFVQMERAGAQEWGTGLLRTRNLADRGAWTTWDGEGFRPIDPVTRRPTRPLRPLSQSRIGKLHHSVSWNDYLNAYLMVGTHLKDGKGGVFFTLSKDLIHWSEPRLLLDMPPCWWAKNDEWCADYAGLLDPDVSTRNFERTGRTPYLYYITWQARVDSTKRKVLRHRIKLVDDNDPKATAARP